MRISSLQINAAGGNEQIYNCFDVAMTEEIREVLSRIPGGEPIYGFERALQAPVIEMSLRGFKVDMSARNFAVRELDVKLARLQHIINIIANAIHGKNLNPNSPQKVKEILYDVLGIPKVRRFAGGEVSYPMDRKVMEELAVRFEVRPLLDAVMTFKDLYGEKTVFETQIDSDWRIRYSFNIAGTTEGRFSSSESSLGTGRNIQNITEDLRYAFIADDGYKICGLDKEQAEARELGWLIGILFNDWTFLDACESGDLHTSTARLVWRELPWTGDLREDRKIADRRFYRMDSYRQGAKKLGHATNIGGSPPAISAATRIPVNLVKDFQPRYFDAYPSIPRYFQWVATQIQTKGYLHNVFGRRRDFFDRHDSYETVKSGLAFMQASPTADDLNLGLWRVWKHMGREVQLLVQLHDAIYFQFKDRGVEYEREIIPEAQRLMDVHLYHGSRRFTVPTEAKVGHNWGPRYKIDDDGNKIDANPRGLDKWKV